MGIQAVTIAVMLLKSIEKTGLGSGLFVGIDTNFVEEEVFNGSLGDIPE